MTGVMLFGRMRKEDRIEYRFNNYKNQIEVKCWEKKVIMQFGITNTEVYV